MTGHCDECGNTMCICPIDTKDDVSTVLVRYRDALKNIINTLGPTSCRCEGLQVEVEMALRTAKEALGSEYV